MFSDVSVLLFTGLGGRVHPVKVLSGHFLSGGRGVPPPPLSQRLVVVGGRGRYCLVMLIGGCVV